MVPVSRTICVITGSRAEYGLLSRLMAEIDADPEMTLQVAVTAAHLDAAFGKTVNVIARDGFAINARIPIELGDDSPLGSARSLAQGISGMAEALGRLSPDVMVVLGDRFEILAAVAAAMMLRVPVAHIHGGEATEGAIDESIRHSVTKMSHLHFTAAEPYRQRVIQLGEAPSRVFNVGAMCLDELESLDLLDREALSDALNFDLGQPYFLVTYHPVTLSEEDPSVAVARMLHALDAFSDHKVIITGVNADLGRNRVMRTLADFVARSEGRVLTTTSLGQLHYFSAMKYADCVVGNSSSGIIEAPALSTPTVNIGDRQRGRVRAATVIDCCDTAEEIKHALSNALDREWRKRAERGAYPFGFPGAARRVKNVLKHKNLHGILMKSFHDLTPGVMT